MIRLPAAVLAPCITVLYRLWCSSLRITEEGRREADALLAAGKPLVVCMWHDELFPFMHIRRDMKIVTIVSQSNDGEYLARLLEALGIRAARGSSSRGGVKALLQAARLIRTQSYSGCITLDGPRGPRHVVKNGAVFLARSTAAHLVPVRAFSERAKVFCSWDRFSLPLPFSRVRVVWGTPYASDQGEISESSLAVEGRKLQERMDALG
ncbi:MAG: lysophospholipid acyltransferase family protein [Desulfovibrio sp.]|nr:lysophospholipid acyltransferase family protein [Desulfovibrio sp.]